MQWFPEFSLGRQRGKGSGAGSISPGGMTTPVRHCPQLCDGPVQKLRLESCPQFRTARPVFPLFPNPHRRRGRGRTHPLPTLPSCSPSGRQLRPGRPCAGLGLRSDSGAVPASAHSIAGRRFRPTGFSHPLRGLITCCCCVGSGLRPHHLNGCCSMPWQALCVAAPCSASGGGSCPWRGTGRGPGCLAARSCLIPCQPPPGRRPARHPLRLV